jgi:hypothetical protein
LMPLSFGAVSLSMSSPVCAGFGAAELELEQPIAQRAEMPTARETAREQA